MLAAAARTLFGALPASRAACAAARAGSPWRFNSAPIATLRSFRSFSPPGSCSSARHTLASSGYCAASSIDTACKLVTWVFASICEAPDASFMFWRGTAAPICLLSCPICSLYGATASTTGMSISGGSAMPRFAPNQGLSSVVPSGAKSGRVAFSRITAARASGIWAMFVTTAPLAEKIGRSGVKMPSAPNLSMNQRSFARASSLPPAMAPACPTARVSLAFHRPTTQATIGLLKSASSS